MALFRELTHDGMMELYDKAEEIRGSIGELGDVLARIEKDRELWDKLDPPRYLACLEADFKPLLERIENELV